jgi:hypothetical protein
MKISEIMAKLATYKYNHGDLDVVIFENNTGEFLSITDVEVLDEKQVLITPEE